MKAMKKVVSVLLLACMLMSVGAVGAYADDDVVIPAPADNAQQAAEAPAAPAAKTTASAGPVTDGADGTDAKDEKDAPKFTVAENTVMFVAGDGNTTQISEVSIEKGEKKTVTVVYNPKTNVDVVIDASNDNISVGSINPAADAVDYGVATAEISGQSAGTVKLVCTISSKEVKDNDGKVTTPSKELASAELSVKVNAGITLVDGNGKSAGEMYNNSTLPLTANITSHLFAGMTPSFTSDNKGIATVDENGVVTGVSEGTACIRASAEKDGVTIYADYNLTVIPALDTSTPSPTPSTDPGTTTPPTESPSTPPTDPGTTTPPTESPSTPPTDPGTTDPTPSTPTIEIKLKDDESGAALDKLSMKPGETRSLIVTGADSANYNHEWSSSNDKAATVKDGVVTAVAAGTATITVKVTPVSSGKAARAAGEAITASVEVTVEAAEIPVTGIVIKYDGKLEMKPGDEKMLTAEITPADATEKVEWSSDNESAVKVDKATGKLSAVGVGTATITARASGTVSAACTVKVIGELAVSSDREYIYLNANSAARTAQLSAKAGETAVAAKDVKWTISGGTDIASIDANGKVTANGSKVGDVVIDGEYTDSGKTYRGSITIHVVEDRIIVVKADNNPIKVSGGEAKIVVTVCQYDESKGTFVETSDKVDSIVAEPVGNSCAGGYSFSVLASDRNKASLRMSYNGKIKVTATLGGLTGSTTVEAKFVPGIVYGNNSVYDGKNMLSFIINDDIDNFSGRLWVDGVLLTRDYHYRAQAVYAGSDDRIQVDLNPAYLNYINKAAYHRIDIGVNNADGEQIVSGYFRTWGTSSGINGVKTGDDSNLALWMLLCLGSAGCATAALISFKKKKQK